MVDIVLEGDSDVLVSRANGDDAGLMVFSQTLTKGPLVFPLETIGPRVFPLETMGNLVFPLSTSSPTSGLFDTVLGANVKFSMSNSVLFSVGFDVGPLDSSLNELASVVLVASAASTTKTGAADGLFLVELVSDEDASLGDGRQVVNAKQVWPSGHSVS